MENGITEIGQRIETAQNDAELSALLVPAGYAAAALQAGLTLQQTAQGLFTARQTALGARGHASATHNGAYLTAAHMYADFRETARAVFTSTAERSALSINSNVPKDAQKFITVVRASYAAAQNDPYKTTLAKYGYPAAHIAEAVAALDAYSTSIESHGVSKSDAEKATTDRNAAYKELVKWNQQFTKIAKVATRTRSDLSKKLNL